MSNYKSGAKKATSQAFRSPKRPDQPARSHAQQFHVARIVKHIINRQISH
jgi:hypothetical protein